MSEEFNPFQSPQSIYSPASSGFARPGSGPFRSGHTLAMWSVALLGLTLLTDVAVGLSSYAQYDLLDRVSRREPIDRQTLLDNDVRQRAVVGGNQICIIALAIPFLMWTYRVYRNLPALGARRPQMSAGMAVGSYFIPVVNLFMPCQAMAEISRGSNPTQRSTDGLTEVKGTSPLVGFWWASHLAINMFGWAIFVFSGDTTAPRSVAPLMSATATLLWFKGLDIIPCILLIFLILGIDKNQQAKYDLILNEPTLI